MGLASRATLFLLITLVAACSLRELAGLPEPQEWVAAGLESAESGMTSRLYWPDLPGVIAAIDGTKLGEGFDRAKLSPGRHVIEYVYHTAEFGVHPEGTIEVELAAAHSYEFHSKLCFWCKPRKHSEWIVDRSTGDLAWGALPTWPSWYL